MKEYTLKNLGETYKVYHFEDTDETYTVRMIELDTIIAASVADEHDSIATNAGENVYATMRDHGISYGAKDTFEASLVETETQYMDTFHPEEKFKSGKYKFSKLPKRYRTAKSVVSCALEAKVNFNGLGKTETEKLINDSRKQNKAEWEKFQGMLDNCRKQWANVPTEDKLSAFTDTTIDYFGRA